ncbi:hypothetical protein MMC19_004557 [Ptychographa xylographoides]|nr:hypothetical protein [Ptychographa xylographoides]
MPHGTDSSSSRNPPKRARHGYHGHNPTVHRQYANFDLYTGTSAKKHSTQHTHVARNNRVSTRHNQNQLHHYYSNGAWHNPNAASVRESRYSDFVPCTYDEQTLLTRLYKYALTFLAQANSTSSPQRTLFRGSNSSRRSRLEDIEMITSSPSPTLLSTSPSPHQAFSRSSNGPYRYTAANSPHLYIKPPSPAAFPKYTPQTREAPQQSHKRSLSSSTRSSHSSATRKLVDASTQYSPPLAPSSLPSSHGSEPAKSGGKRKERSISPSPTTEAPPPEPQLPPQMPLKRSVTPASSIITATAIPAGTASTTTLANSSSSSSSQGSSPKRARPPRAAAKFMPVAYETCDVKDLVLLISNMLMELIRFNDEIPLKDGRLTRFHSRAPPAISVMDYLQRLTTHATLSPPILLSMVYYIDRLCALYPAFTISSLTVHRFLITSATVASKGLSDSFWTNNTYARVGGVSLKELALLELEFLWRVEWRIVPKPEVLVDYYRSLVERSEGFEIEVEAPGKQSPHVDKMVGVEKGD